MGRSRWIVLAVLALALVTLQHYGLERQPEKQEEDQYTRLADLPPGEMLPTYIASLFFGSFRAVAIDLLWIQLKSAQEERRWYKAKEITELLSFLQPRNEEVWSMLGWDFAYNVSYNARDEEEAWQWTRYGIVKLREGCRRNPRSPYLHSTLAMTLWHFPTRYGRIDMSICKRIEADDELQKMLQDVEVLQERKSPFELAIRWYEKARVELERMREDPQFEYYKTQMGLILYPDTMDGFARKSGYLQAVYLWKQALSPDSRFFDDSKQWFAWTAEHTRRMRDKYRYMIILEDCEILCDGMPRVLDLHRELLRAPGRESKLAYLRGIESLLSKVAHVDERFLYYEACALKRELSAERIKFGQQPEKTVIDEHEWNDMQEYATPIVVGAFLRGNLKPGPGDVDTFVFFIAPEHHGDRDHAHHDDVPRKVTIEVQRFGKQPLRVRVYKSARGADWKRVEKTLFEKDVPDRHLFTVEVDKPGEYAIEVRALDESGPVPADTRYGVQLISIQ